MLEAGVDVNRRFGNELTALMWAAGYPDDVDVGDGVATVELLLAKGAQLDLADNRGRTALMIAAERGHAEIVKLLLAAGADPARRDKDGRSAADIATDAAVRTALLP
jgi:ankyrin repeat protein